MFSCFSSDSNEINHGVAQSENEHIVYFRIQGSKVKIRLECNHSLDTVEDAEFVLRQDEKDPLVSIYLKDISFLIYD